VGQYGDGPAQALQRRQVWREDRRDRIGVPSPVRLLDRLGVQTQHRPDAGHRLVGERVLLAEQVGQRRAQARVRGHQVGPLWGVALQILNRGSQRRLAAESEGFEKGKIALAGSDIADGQFHRLARPRDQVGRAALDQEEKRARPPGRETAEHLVAREEVIRRHVYPVTILNEPLFVRLTAHLS
jgi:hypothetical protein